MTLFELREKLTRIEQIEKALQTDGDSMTDRKRESLEWELKCLGSTELEEKIYEGDDQ